MGATVDVSRPRFHEVCGILAKHGSSSNELAERWVSHSASGVREGDAIGAVLPSLSFVHRPTSFRCWTGRDRARVAGCESVDEPYADCSSRAHLAERLDRLLAACLKAAPNFEEPEGTATLSMQRETGRLD